MQRILKKYGIFGIALILLLPALLINLGVMTFIDDEAIRALVALEMKLSGNYITPTLHGEFYYNKPPLFNWILSLFFAASGKFDEFTARFPTILALLGYALSVFVIFMKRYDWKTGFLVSFMLITCGRILFWDSMLALIDILFSWVVFGLFMVVYHCFSRQKWGALFFWTYVLTAIGFLLKGLPIIVFQSITLITYFAYTKQIKRLFSWAHIFGVLTFALIIGSYYALYLQYNTLDTVFQTLFQESSKRTVAAHGIGQTILHLFTFPFEMTYHFFPWSLMALYFIDRRIIQRIREDTFLEFLTLVFLANVLIYWSSPGIYPRYLLMFIPLVFGVGIRLHEGHKAQKTWQFRIFDGFLLFVAGLIALSSWAPLVFERLEGIPYLSWKVLFLGISTGLIFIFTAIKAKNRIFSGVLVLLLARIGFNWFVIPDRNAHDFGDICRKSSEEVGSRYRDEQLFVFGETDMQPTNSFYLTHARGKIIPRVSDIEEIEKPLDRTALYIVDTMSYPMISMTKRDSIYVRHGKLTYAVGYLAPEFTHRFFLNKK